jgi:hypothetical protein
LPEKDFLAILQRVGFHDPKIIARREDIRGTPTIWADVIAFKR